MVGKGEGVGPAAQFDNKLIRRGVSTLEVTFYRGGGGNKHRVFRSECKNQNDDSKTIKRNLK